MVALLSLKLILLAFFILLNALSVIEDDRQRVVIDSVSQAFDGRIQAFKNLSDKTSASGPLDGAERLARALADLLDSTLPAIRVVEGARHSEVRLELPVAMLFEPGAVELESGRDFVMKRLSEALLREARQGVVFKTEVRHGVPEGVLSQLNGLQGRSLELRRIGHLAQRFVELGLSPQRISTGLEVGRPGAVFLSFRVFQPDNEDIP